MMTMITQSETFSDKLDGICRLCLKGEGPMSSIFTTASCSETDDKDVLAARITSIAQVQISPSDGLPTSICHVCRQQVDKFYDFRLLVEISDRKLRSCYEGVQNISELQRIVVQATQATEDVDYKEFSASTSSMKDVLSVNAILVPSTSGMQVWQFCSAEGEEIVAERRPKFSMAEESASVCEKLGYPGDTDDSEVDDFEGMKRCLASGGTAITIEAIRDEDELYFTTATAASVPDEGQASCGRNVRLETADDEDYDEEHLIMDEYSCQLCLKPFKALEALKNHVSDHFLAEKRPNSNDIGSVDRREQEIDASCMPDYVDDQDNMIDADEPPTEEKYLDSLICHSCDETFESMEERLRHAQRHVGSNEGLKCRHCDKSFLKLSSRNYHEDSIHGPRGGKSHKCDECGKEFGKRSELRYHKGTHTDSPSTCTICNKHFRNVQSFKMHLKRHTLGSRYNCPDCGKSYYTNSELARHVQQHTGLREYPCDLCDMSFLSRPELNRHVKYHNGVKKFECKVCRKTYYESGHLKVHERVHTGERPFACTVCKKGFITKSKLVRHFKVHERARTSARDSVNVCEQYRFTK